MGEGGKRVLNYINSGNFMRRLWYGISRYKKSAHKFPPSEDLSVGKKPLPRNPDEVEFQSNLQSTWTHTQHSRVACKHTAHHSTSPGGGVGGGGRRGKGVDQSTRGVKRGVKRIYEEIAPWGFLRKGFHYKLYQFIQLHNLALGHVIVLLTH